MSTEPTTKSSSSPAKLNIRALEEAWRKERRQQEEGHVKEVRSLNGNTRPLRGGDWIASRGTLMTIGVTWINECDNKKYGLTVAPAFVDHGLGVGDSVFAFDSDDESAINPDGTRAHKSIKIGTVVSLDDEETDSVIIEIFPHIIIDPLAVALSRGDDHVYKITLPKPFATSNSDNSSVSTFPCNKQRMVMFGATGRGMIGTSDGGGSKPNNKNDDVTATEVLVEGRGDTVEICDATTNHYVLRQQPQFDCGALYLDEDGIAWCMHTMRNVWTSHGTFLQNIVDRHPIYFGHSEPIDGSVSNASSQMRQQSSNVSLAWEKIVLPLTYGAYPRMKYPDIAKDFFCIRQPALPISRIPMYFSDEENDCDEPGMKDDEKKRDR